jgi:peptide/nickel transport system permease protein
VTGAWARFRRARTNVIALAIIGALVLVAASADFLASDHPILLRWQGHTFVLPNVIDYPALAALDNRRLREEMGPDDWAIFPLDETGPYSVSLRGLAGTPPRAPSSAMWLGSDNAGRDTLSRLVHGTRISLSIGLVAVGIYIAIGTLLGLAAGYFGGWVDTLISRTTEIMLNFPLLFLLLALQGILEQTSIFSTMVVIGLTRWPEATRLLRAEVLRVRELEYVQAIRALGGSTPRILFLHILPNAMGPLLVTASFGVASAILIESALSFLGFGAPEPTASWGLLMTDGFQSMSNPHAWPLVVLPGLAVFLTVASFNLVGEGIRDAIDPRMRVE